MADEKPEMLIGIGTAMHAPQPNLMLAQQEMRGQEPTSLGLLLSRAVQEADRVSPLCGQLLRSAVKEYNRRMAEINGR